MSGNEQDDTSEDFDVNDDDGENWWNVRVLGLRVLYQKARKSLYEALRGSSTLLNKNDDESSSSDSDAANDSEDDQDRPRRRRG